MIYVSLTTIPSRVGDIEPCIRSLLGQTVKPDHIFINIPYKYKRFEREIDVSKIPFFDKIVRIVRCQDYGPGTKLMGCKDLLERDSLLVLVDDDHIYKNYMIETFVKMYRDNPSQSYSFDTHSLKYVVAGKGADGIAINTNSLDRLHAYYELIKDDRFLFLHDDAWISFYLQLRKYPVVCIKDHLHPNDEEIFIRYIKTDSLVDLTHEFSRENVDRYCDNYFREHEESFRQIIC